ncbi:tryptophan--tRNA ligase, partial [Candidatus Gottesmanbacteria bacterium]|nr:tryptophan--tRNA ligase [Candidatus Gottesmanbacteria bacterium]
MKRFLSGITPSGDGTLHIGNYLGAVKQFIDLSVDHDCYLMVADLHALTTIQNKEQLQKNTETLILNELALLVGELGFTLPNITFFRQSDVPMHAELQTILNNVTPLGLIKRAHAYKDKLAKETALDEINMGLFNYPVLMAADILIYKSDLVPVGRDQKQHIEIARDIAESFNKIYCGDPSTTSTPLSTSSLRTRKSAVFPLPEPYIPEDVAVVLGTDGKRKMSKSLGNIISIFEDEEVIKKQVMGTFTDPTRIHATDPGHLEGNMVFTYLDFFGVKKDVEALKSRYQAGKVTDVEVKNYLFESLLKYFAKARESYKELNSNPDKVSKILKDGVEKARRMTEKTLTEVREVIGLTNKYSFFSYNKG